MSIISLFPHNLGGYFTWLFVELIAGKNVSPSDKNCGNSWKTSSLWRNDVSIKHLLAKFFFIFEALCFGVCLSL